MPNKPIVPTQPGAVSKTAAPTPTPTTEDCVMNYPTPHDGEPCPPPVDPDCKGWFNGHMSGHIALNCVCNCPVYVDHFVMLAPTTPQANVYSDITTWLTANPGAKFGSITDLEHSGWLLHVHLPV
jgi:hypothetical protein